MVYLRSINRFILISLALLGLSVSSANAEIVQVWENNFGLNDQTYNSYEFGRGAIEGDAPYNIVDDFYIGEITTVTDIDVWLFKDSLLDFSDITISIGGQAVDILGRLVEDDTVLPVPAAPGANLASFLVNFDIKDLKLDIGVYSLQLSSNIFTGIGWRQTTGEGDAPGPAPDFFNLLKLPTTNGTEGGADTQFDMAFNINGEIGSASPVPVPAAVWLFGTALIGFIGMSRRRKVA